MAANTVVLATRNAAKLRELARILGMGDPGGTQIKLVDLDEFPGAPDVPETGATFEENALLKARAIADYTGLPAVADDSGLCVDALWGGPGVLSARFASGLARDPKNRLLLSMIPPGQPRTARFVCVLAWAPMDGGLRLFSGAVEGVLAAEPRGDQGFGYDPIFIPEGMENTFGELAAEVKHRLSHRANACRAFLGSL